MTIKSRPLYADLKIDGTAKRHIIIVDSAGAAPVLLLLSSAGPDVTRNVSLIHAGAAPGVPGSTDLAGLDCDIFVATPGTASALFHLDALLAKATMGTRIYVCGTEGLIGQTVALVQRHGVKPMSVRQQHCGSLKRRVQCVHCKGITEDVTARVAPCAHCGVPLFVRDHFSRRLGAFMGVSADAEEPGLLPPVEEGFP